MPYANNKSTDQPVLPPSLISEFVVRCLDSTSGFFTQNFKPLPSFCSCAGRFESTLVKNTEDRVSRDKVQLIPNFRLDFNCPREVMQDNESIMDVPHELKILLFLIVMPHTEQSQLIYGIMCKTHSTQYFKIYDCTCAL